jgi:hypothetical protein
MSSAAKAVGIRLFTYGLKAVPFRPWALPFNREHLR